ncbi:hypothetical protein [Roseicella aerolata]|uniref:Lipoprotein n=1 Tax=Roseicella aerolata TaxID=2883479 RepID=A0A9X1IFV9_9PROT|nr:hypothetical protein [Roseicella aerolata]MCB4823349.1 hypothetical protein [Roseicella aerolata]
MRFAPLLLLLGLVACAGPRQSAEEADLTAVRAVSLSTQALSWEELRIHPALMQRPCAVHTLVNEEAVVVGYCERGKRCRTNDWRPVLDGCQPAQGPGMTPAPTGSGLEVANRR